MKPKSSKAKGRKAATEVRDHLLSAFPELNAADLRVTPTGVNGEDIQRSSRASELIPYAFEVKCQESIRIWQTLEQAKTHIKNDNDRPVVVFRRNRTPFHVCLELDTFLQLISTKGETNGAI